MSRKGTDPLASPKGIPCKKYKRTSKRKLRRSWDGSSQKPLPEGGCPGVVGVTGSSSTEKVLIPIRWAVCDDELPSAAE